MGAGELIDERVSLKQCQRAVDELLKFALKKQKEREETELLPGAEQHVWLQVATKRMYAEKKLKPFRIPIAHPLVDPRTSSICLITKDPQREYKELLDEKGVKFVSRVVGLEKLKGKFKPFEARRLLLKENDLFLADNRVIPLLPGLLGKKFFQAKKQPIPVDLTRKDVKTELERAVSSTYFHQNQGTCASVKIGTISQASNKVVANLKIALPAVVKAIKGEWDNVQSLSLKTSTSVSLPIWTCDLGAEEGGRWEGLIAEVDESASEDEEDDDAEDSEVGKEASENSEDADEDQDEEMEVDVPKSKAKGGKSVPVPASAKVKGAKRGAEMIDDDSNPKKKPKTNSAVDKAKAAPSSDSAAKPAKKSKNTPTPATITPPKESPSLLQRKQKQAIDTVPAPSVSADTITADEVASKPKRRKSKAVSGEAVGSSEATGTVITASSTSSLDPSTGNGTVAATPVPTKKKGRAIAVDFFEDNTPSHVTSIQDTPGPSKLAPPPNTPADGLSTPATTTSAKKKKHTKTAGDVPATPISGVIEKLSLADPTHDKHEASTESTLPSDKRSKKPRHKKSQKAAPGTEEAVPKPVSEDPATPDQPIETATPAPEAGQRKKRKHKSQKTDDTDSVEPATAPSDTSVSETSQPPPVTDASDETKRKKRKHKKTERDDLDAQPSAPSTALTVDELKQKRSDSIVEKKKEKLGKRKKTAESAKEGLIGKKGLTTV